MSNLSKKKGNSHSKKISSSIKNDCRKKRIFTQTMFPMNHAKFIVKEMSDHMTKVDIKGKHLDPEKQNNEQTIHVQIIYVSCTQNQNYDYVKGKENQWF